MNESLAGRLASSSRPRAQRFPRALLHPPAVTGAVVLLPVLTLGLPVLLMRAGALDLADEAIAILVGILMVQSGAAYLLVLPLLVCAAHLLGHLAASRLVGFRLHRCTIGPLRVAATGGDLRPGLNRRWSDYWGAFDAAPDDWCAIGRRTALVAAGGPAASLLLALALLAIDGFAGGPFIVHFMLLRPAALISGGLALGSAIAFTSGGFLTDGARIARAWAGGLAAERRCALQFLRSAVALGQRPQAWATAWTAAATAFPDDSAEDVEGRLFAFWGALDRGEATAAAAHLDRALALEPLLHEPVRALALIEAAYVAAAIRGDAAAARAYLARAGSRAADTFPFVHARAEAALLLLAERRKEAGDLLDTGLRLLAAAGELDAGAALAEEVRLRDLRSRSTKTIEDSAAGKPEAEAPALSQPPAGIDSGAI
jgi:hypothetical protein